MHRMIPMLALFASLSLAGVCRRTDGCELALRRQRLHEPART